MIEWLKMNERLHDMTPNRMLLDISISPNKTEKKIQQTSNFNYTACNLTRIIQSLYYSPASRPVKVPIEGAVLFKLPVTSKFNYTACNQ